MILDTTVLWRLSKTMSHRKFWMVCRSTSCPGKRKPQLFFASFHGANIPMVANFKLLTLSLNMGWGRDIHGKLWGASSWISRSSRSWGEHATSMSHCAILRIYFCNFNSLSKMSLCTYIDGFRAVSQPCYYWPNGWFFIVVVVLSWRAVFHITEGITESLTY